MDGGELAWHSLRRFCIYRRGNRWLGMDWLEPGAAFLLPSAVVAKWGGTRAALPEAILTRFIRPVISTAPIVIRQRCRHPGDDHFWQYPCGTERQADENHQKIALGANLDRGGETIHTYLGLPWATYIDRKRFPEEILQWLRPRITGWRRLAWEQGYRLAVHTVCQQIYWRRLIDRFRELGVTDLHLSHCERAVREARTSGSLRIHSWPLIAVNVEDHTRGEGLEPGRLVACRRYLASFIGAYLPHYRSDARLRLLDAARRDGGDDVIVEVSDEWHFEKTVYQEQVGNIPLTLRDRESQAAATRRYNEVLSDSVFSLCPEGAGPNTLRLWESLAVGAIPVILAEQWEPPACLRRSGAAAECCLFFKASEIGRLFTELRAINRERIRSMSAAGPRVYAEARELRAFAVNDTGVCGGRNIQ